MLVKTVSGEADVSFDESPGQCPSVPCGSDRRRVLRVWPLPTNWGSTASASRCLKADDDIGGLAGSFPTHGARLEKFYHHWFTSDVHVRRLIEELGQTDRILLRPTRTGMYYAHDFFKLSTPFDLLRFSPLPLLGRIRLGLLALRARRLKDWRSLEDRTAADWLRELGGEQVYRIVWEPLLRGKFGDVAEEVAAVWFWNKLKLRGSSRGRGEEEQLAYYRGGFAALAETLAAAVRAQGGTIRTNMPVNSFREEAGRVTGVVTPEGTPPRGWRDRHAGVADHCRPRGTPRAG